MFPFIVSIGCVFTSQNHLGNSRPLDLCRHAQFLYGLSLQFGVVSFSSHGGKGLRAASSRLTLNLQPQPLTLNPNPSTRTLEQVCRHRLYRIVWGLPLVTIRSIISTTRCCYWPKVPNWFQSCSSPTLLTGNAIPLEKFSASC